MSSVLLKNCCLLCMHDGSEHALLDVFSVTSLGDRIAEEYDIKINANGSLSEICVQCFQETLNFRKQRRLYQEEKERILKNQHRLQLQTSRGAKGTNSLASANPRVAPNLQHGNNSKEARRPSGVSGGATVNIEAYGKLKGLLKFDFKRKSNASNNNTNALGSEKNTISKKVTNDDANVETTVIAPDKRNHDSKATGKFQIQPETNSKHTLETRKRVRFSIQDDTSEDNDLPSQKKQKSNKSGEEAEVVTKKPTPQNEEESNKQENRIPAVSANGQKGLKEKNAKPQKTSTDTGFKKRQSGEQLENRMGTTVSPIASSRPNIVSSATNGAKKCSEKVVTMNPEDAKQPKPLNVTDQSKLSIPITMKLKNKCLVKVKLAETVHNLGKNRSLGNTTGITAGSAIVLTQLATNSTINSSAVEVNAQSKQHNVPIACIKPSSTVIGTEKNNPTDKPQTPIATEAGHDQASSTFTHQMKTVELSTSASSTSNNSAQLSQVNQIPATLNLCAKSAPNQDAVHRIDGRTPSNQTDSHTTQHTSAALSTTHPAPTVTLSVPMIASFLSAAGPSNTKPLPNTSTVYIIAGGLKSVTSSASPAVITVSEVSSIYTVSGPSEKSSVPLVYSTTNSTQLPRVSTTLCTPAVATSVADDSRHQRNTTVEAPTVPLLPAVEPLECQPSPCVEALPSQQKSAPAIADPASSSASTSPTGAGIKKRRHSTFIRVSTNLFDEPDAQFASIRQNSLIRQVVPTSSSLQIQPFHKNTASGCSTTTSEHQNVHTNNTVPSSVSTGDNLVVVSKQQPPQNRMVAFTGNVVQHATNNTIQAMEIPEIPAHVVYKPLNNEPPRILNHTIMPNRMALSNAVIVDPRNNALRFDYTYSNANNRPQNSTVADYWNTSRASTVAGTKQPSTNGSTSNAVPAAVTNQAGRNVAWNATKNQTNDTQRRSVIMCQLCTEFFLTVPLVAAHLNQVHYVECTPALYSTVFDDSIWKLLIARSRRKSIATPNDFTSARQQST